MRYLTTVTDSVLCDDLAALTFGQKMANDTSGNIAVALDARDEYVVAPYDVYVQAPETLRLVKVCYPETEMDDTPFET